MKTKRDAVVHPRHSRRAKPFCTICTTTWVAATTRHGVSAPGRYREQIDIIQSYRSIPVTVPQRHFKPFGLSVDRALPNRFGSTISRRLVPIVLPRTVLHFVCVRRARCRSSRAITPVAFPIVRPTSRPLNRPIFSDRVQCVIFAFYVLLRSADALLLLLHFGASYL